MPFGETKVYFDGSHYIAIPYAPNPRKRRAKPPEEIITVVEEDTENNVDEGLADDSKPLIGVSENEETSSTDIVEEVQEETIKPKRARTSTRKELFEELYRETKDMRKAERKRYIAKKMLPYFRDGEAARNYVEQQFDRKHRNAVCRRVRLTRKVNLHDFTYFCTFTYDDKKHTEESFQKKLKACFRNLCYRRGWKYVGVWERSPEKKRLHFHGLFYIPDGADVGEYVKKKDFNFKTRKREEINENTYFLKNFGRNDFEPIVSRRSLGNAIAYLVKYMEKTGEKIVYSKGLPQYFITDIMDEDVVCTIGQEDRKLLLFDDFNCWDEGTLMGRVSRAVIAQMRTTN